MSRCKEQINLDGVDEALGKLISAQITLGKEALKILGTGLGQVKDSLGNMSLPKTSTCCDIPEPCWMPVNLGDICCQLKPGDSGEICLYICNEDFRAHSYTVHAEGDLSGLVQISEKQINLSAKMCHVTSARFTMPTTDTNPDQISCCNHNDHELVLWVQGCRNHYLRWHLNSSTKSKDCCHEISVADKPDYELHWYDHFHILRHCPAIASTDIKTHI